MYSDTDMVISTCTGLRGVYSNNHQLMISHSLTLSPSSSEYTVYNIVESLRTHTSQELTQVCQCPTAKHVYWSIINTE